MVFWAYFLPPHPFYYQRRVLGCFENRREIPNRPNLIARNIFFFLLFFSIFFSRKIEKNQKKNPKNRRKKLTKKIVFPRFFDFFTKFTRGSFQIFFVQICEIAKFVGSLGFWDWNILKCGDLVVLKTNFDYLLGRSN